MKKILEKYIFDSTERADNLSKTAETASDLAVKKKTPETHFTAAKAHLAAYELHKKAHLKMQDKDNSDIYAWNRTKNLANLHYRKFMQHKKFTTWK